jgi:HAD superfamily hydrolase (TIGR01509 family)
MKWYKMVDLSINGKVFEDIDLLIFDKDGTLFELYPYCSKMVDERTTAIMKVLKNQEAPLRDWLIHKMGVDLENQKIYPHGPIGVYSKYYAQNMLYQKMNEKGYKIDKQMLKEAFTEADHNINHVNYLKEALIPVNGMIKFIETIGKKSKCAIFSNDMTQRLLDSLKIFNLIDYFDYVLGGDLVKEHKPNPQGNMKIMEELQVSPSNTAFFGDSALDIESAKRANCQYIFSILSDISDLEYTKKNSDALITDFTQINVL